MRATTSYSSPTIQSPSPAAAISSDEYFTRDKRSNFIDLDLVVAGPIVPQLSASFDAFWNSKYAYPISSLAAPVSAESVTPPLQESPPAGDSAWLESELDAHTLTLDWVPAHRAPPRIGREDRERSFARGRSDDR